jgi:PhzF family phenazine biosynthesis protein
MTEILRYAAFTTDPSGGNPAGVVLDASELSEEEMQRIATEVGYSETAFVTGEPEFRTFTLRYFSPEAEVPFCGHATIATAVALAERRGAGHFTARIRPGTLELTTEQTAQGIEAGMESVPTSTRPVDEEELTRLLETLRWSGEDLDPTLPPHVAYAGNHHPVVAAATRERLADLDYDVDGLRELMLEQDWTTVQLVWREDPTTFHARDPFPVGGVVEDPATGAAAAALGGYLRELGEVLDETTIIIHQGADMGRPSLIHVRVDPGNPRVRVSGTAVPIEAEGDGGA